MGFRVAYRDSRGGVDVGHRILPTRPRRLFGSLAGSDFCWRAAFNAANSLSTVPPSSMVRRLVVNPSEEATHVPAG